MTLGQKLAALGIMYIGLILVIGLFLFGCVTEPPCEKRLRFTPDSTYLGGHNADTTHHIDTTGVCPW